LNVYCLLVCQKFEFFNSIKSTKLLDKNEHARTHAHTHIANRICLNLNHRLTLAKSHNSQTLLRTLRQ